MEQHNAELLTIARSVRVSSAWERSASWAADEGTSSRHSWSTGTAGSSRSTRRRSSSRRWCSTTWPRSCSKRSVDPQTLRRHRGQL